MSSTVLINCFFILLMFYIVKADTEDDLLNILLKRKSPCKISLQCPTKHSICYEHECKVNVPCNKDNDCFFYGAADIANGNPHPKCYKVLNDASIPAGYGYCMLAERVKYDPNLVRLKGGDVDSLDEHPIDTSNMQ